MLIFEEQDARNDQDYNTQWRDNKETDWDDEAFIPEISVMVEACNDLLHDRVAADADEDDEVSHSRAEPGWSDAAVWVQTLYELLQWLHPEYHIVEAKSNKESYWHFLG